MPVNHTDTLNTKIDELERRLRALEQSNVFEHASIFNGALNVFDVNGNLNLVLGLQSDLTYGLALYDPATGNKVMHLGHQPDGTVGLAIYTSSGVKEVQLGQLATGYGQYGLAVLNAAGILQAVSGTTTASASSSQFTTSTSFVTFSDDPKVTATVGPSGQALISIGAQIQVGGDNDGGNVQLSLDGVYVPAIGVLCSSSGVSDQVITSGSTTLVLTGLTPGSHVFSLKYQCVTGTHGVVFSNRFVTVSPF